MKKDYWIYQYLLLHYAALVFSESYYSIVAPGYIKSNRKYSVAVSLHDAYESSTIRISVMGPIYNVSEQVELRPFESKFIDFWVPKLDNGDYKLKAEGIRGIQFKNESQLFVDTTSGPKIYIQTDKAVYKPKDFVQFRVVILDQHTRPVQIREPIRIEIVDDQKNRVKQFKDISLNKGVYTGNFQLSEQPVLGHWKIDVIISGKYSHSASKNFQVKKYVLPRFNVHIETPSDVVLQDGTFKAVIYGKYTFGKYVQCYGFVELWNGDETILIDRKILDVENWANVEFNLENSTVLVNTHKLKVFAELTEKHTGIARKNYHIIMLRHQHYNIVIPPDDIEFRQNKPYRLKAHISYWTGAPVLDSKNAIRMDHGSMKFESYLDENGIATFEFEHHSEAGHMFTYKDSKMSLPNIYEVPTLEDDNTKYYCKLDLVESPRLGKPVEIVVTSMDHISYFIYTIVSHGSLVRMEHIKMAPNKKSYTIKIIPSIEMIPESFVYVHYIQNGNLRYEEIKLTFPDELENQISVEAPREVKPGQEVTLILNAQPKSYVSILAVDLSVYLLDSTYDLYKNTIIRDLRYDRTYIPLVTNKYPGLISGLITLTNAHFPFFEIQRDMRPSGGGGSRAVPRTKFPETWIFKNIEINDTKTELTLNIPDTITTWRITAFSNNELTGFGIVDGPTDITTIQPFFISPNLPYSVKREEILNMTITIFNYLNQTLDTEVVMYNDNDEFEFMESSINSPGNYNNDNKKRIQQITVNADGGKTIAFLIKPQILGEITLHVTATNSLYSDAVQQKLKVEPEGVTKYHNQAVYLSLDKDEESIASSFIMEIPLDCVPDSEFITLSVGGDYLTPALENLQGLVQKPTGCGEQNMVNLAPNILILQYLKATGKYSQQQKLVKLARYYIEIGYQQELSFRHTNGGYSVFGAKSSRAASTWLTAYVIRFFIKASKYIPIEARIIETGLDYLASEQLENGEFSYTGYLFDPAHQNEYGFTAFVLMTFLEDRKYSRRFKKTIQNGTQYLNSNLNSINDVYALSIVANALKMAKEDSANRVIEKLRQFSTTDDKGNMWWSGRGSDGSQEKDVEITAYVLMALLEMPGDHMPTLRWLVEQRNAEGGFKSTHDTVVGLQALVKFSEKYNSLQDINLKMTYSVKDQYENDIRKSEFSVKPDNSLILQRHELPKTTRYIDFEITGTGHSLLQLSFQYNIINEDKIKYFLIEPKVQIPNSYELYLDICFTYQPDVIVSNSTNMVIMEVNLPSGFRSDAESSQDLIDNEFVQRIESKNGESTIIFYFDKLSINMKHCVYLKADKTGDVMMRKPAAIVMYDYYNTNRLNTVFYNMKT